MKPYCPNNSNFTFREITCAPVKKHCDKPKDDCSCNCGNGWCDELLNCILPDQNCPFCKRDKAKDEHNCGCNHKQKCDCDKMQDYGCRHNFCDNCYPCHPSPCCTPTAPCENNKRTLNRRPIIIIFKK